MGVTVKTAPKAKAKAKPKVEMEVVSAESIEALAALDATMRKAKGAFESAKKAYDEAVEGAILRAEALGQLGATEKLLLEGPKHTLWIGAKTNVSEIDTLKAFEVLRGVDEGLPETLAKFTVADLKAYLTPPQYAEVVAMHPVGKRRVAIKPK